MKAKENYNMNEENEKFLSGKIACEILDTSSKTLRKWVKEGYLQGYKTPGNRLLFKQADIYGLVKKIEAEVSAAYDEFKKGVNEDVY